MSATPDSQGTNLSPHVLALEACSPYCEVDADLDSDTADYQVAKMIPYLYTTVVFNDSTLLLRRSQRCGSR